MARKILFKDDGISQTSNSPSGYKFIGYDGTVASQKSGSIVTPLGGSGGSVTFQEQVTYSELNSLISSSSLISGKSYLITDYKTIYIQPDWSDKNTSVPVGASLIKEGVIEPLIVNAISNNELSPIAISASFSSDVIFYSPVSENLYTGYDTMGKITRRIDAAGNDIPFDFRSVKFKVYPDLSYDGYRYYDNGNSSLEKYIFTNKDLQDNSYQSSVKNNVIKYSVDLDYDNGHSSFGIWGINTTFLGSQILNNKLDGFISNCCLVGDEAVADITLSNVVLNSYFQGGLRLRTSNFSGNINKCTFVGSTVTNNYFNSNIVDVIISVSNFYHNTVMIYGSSIQITGTSFMKNNIKSNSFNFFNCSGGMYNNNINCDTFSKSGFFSGSTSSVTLFANNDINNNSFESFTFSSFTNNIVKGYLSNVSGQNFISNTIGPGFSFNNVVFSPSNNVVLNNFMSTSGYFSGDFSTASHIYSEYDCDIFMNSLSETKLRYVDSTGNWDIVYVWM